MLEKWALIALIGVALFFTGFMKGCEQERDRWELLSAKAKNDASDETARRLKAKDELLYQSREREKQLIADRNRADASSRMLLQAIKDRSGNTAVASPSETRDTFGELLGNCSQEYRLMAEKADRAYAAGELCSSVYESLSNKQKVKSFLKEATK